MAQNNLEADKMLDLYVHDYLKKRNMQNSAQVFMAEAKVAADQAVIDAPGGFLFAWWSLFWELFITRTTDENPNEAAAAYIKTQQIKARDHQEMQAQQLQMMIGQPSANVLAMNMYEEHMKHPYQASNHQGSIDQGNSGVMSASLQQTQGMNQITMDTEQDVNLGEIQKFLAMDSLSMYGQTILQSNSGLGAAALNQGVSGLPLNDLLLTGIDPFLPSIDLQTQCQLLLASQQQQVVARAQAEGNLRNPPNFSFSGLPRGSLNIKDSQTLRNDGSIFSLAQSLSPKMEMTRMQKSSSQQQGQLQQLQKNKRKRKHHSSSGPTNNITAGNTVGPSPSCPHSVHTRGNGSCLQHVNNVSESKMMDGAEASALASSTNQLDDKLDSFILPDGGDGGNLSGSLKQGGLPERIIEPYKDFSFGEVSCIRMNKKFTCCHFSSDGEVLASAGYDRKAVLWNMDTLRLDTTPAEHHDVITDIRFRPNSTEFATVSYDKSVRMWDAANPSLCLHAYTGHSSPIFSLDFNPKKTDLFCFSDSSSEIRYWTIGPFTCSRVSKQRGSLQVRFHPISGHLLAAASDKVVSIYDVETDRQMHSFEGHSGVVNYLCWDHNGEFLASVSEDSAKVWSLASGNCIHDLSSNGDQFHSCAFHPSNSALLVIGGNQDLQLWNMAENKYMAVPAHKKIIAALSQSPRTGTVASASNDNSLKIWR